MPRTAQEIASDLKQAVALVVETNAEIASIRTNNVVAVPAAVPQIVVRLRDGRIVELGALADELLRVIS